jgi:hypothetical protein
MQRQSLTGPGGKPVGRKKIDDRIQAQRPLHAARRTTPPVISRTCDHDNGGNGGARGGPPVAAGGGGALRSSSYFFLPFSGGLSLPSSLPNSPAAAPFAVGLSWRSSRMFATRTSRAASRLFGLIDTTFLK